MTRSDFQCPGCKSLFSVNLEKATTESLLVECPTCRMKVRVRVPRPPAPVVKPPQAAVADSAFSMEDFETIPPQKQPPNPPQSKRKASKPSMKAVYVGLGVASAGFVLLVGVGLVAFNSGWLSTPEPRNAKVNRERQGEPAKTTGLAKKIGSTADGSKLSQKGGTGSKNLEELAAKMEAEERTQKPTPDQSSQTSKTEPKKEVPEVKAPDEKLPKLAVGTIVPNVDELRFPTDADGRAKDVSMTEAADFQPSKDFEPAPNVPTNMNRDPVSFVYLEKFRHAENPPTSEWHDVLKRELARQALLITAREHFGMNTRDEALGETPLEGLPEKHRFYVKPQYHKTMQHAVFAVAGPKNEQKHLWNEMGRFNLQSPDFLAKFFENESRNTLVHGFRGLGFVDRPNAWKLDTPVPDSIEKLLDSWTITTQFDAIRQLHGKIRAQGESPALLGALVRGYANLGSLTDAHWDLSHKIFKARSLLYAERLARRVPNTPWSHAHRAYAYAMTGLHGEAIKALETVEKSSPRAKDLDPSQSILHQKPDWLTHLRHFCHYDHVKLLDLVETGPRKVLAAYLRFNVMEEPEMHQITLKAAEPILKLQTDCYRVRHVISALTAVDISHESTEAGPRVFLETLPKNLLAISGLPGSTARVLKEKPHEKEIYRSLREASRSGEDPSEPSWSLLGRIAHSERFLQIERRLNFLKFQLSAFSPKDASDAFPIVEGHPYEPFVRAFALNARAGNEEVRKLLMTLPVNDFQNHQFNSFRHARLLEPGFEEKMTQAIFRNRDFIYQDYRYMPSRSTLGIKAESTQVLAEISPFSPRAQEALIESDWERAKKELNEWEKHSIHPLALRALALRKVNDKEPDAAREYIKKAMQLSCDYATVNAYGIACKKKMNYDEWRRVMKEYLATNPHGLDAGRVNAEMAWDQMGLREYQKALPYARAASSTGSGWGTECEAACQELLGDFESAEKIIREVALRYPNTFRNWFFWCHRTGKGDLNAATEYFLKGFKSPNVTSAEPYDMAQYHAIRGETEKAVEILAKLENQKAMKSTGILFYGILLEELGRVEERKKVWKYFDDDTTTITPDLIAIMDQASSKENPRKFDVPTIEKTLKVGSMYYVRGSSTYLLGRFLELHGQTDVAKNLYSFNELRLNPPTMAFSVLAAQRIREIEKNSKK